MAMLDLSTVQVTGAPAMTLPLASFTVAVSCEVCPVVTVTLVGATTMLAPTAEATAIPAVPVLPSLVAVMFAVPLVTPLTRPVLSTVATDSSSEDHVIVRPESTLPLASSGSATRCTVSPTLMAALVGETRTDATGGGMTMIVATPDLPPELAAMCTVPSAMPVTTPEPDTVAMEVFSELQKMLGVPLAPSTVACRATVDPSGRESVDGVMVTPFPPPPGPVESLPHDNAIAQASDDRNSMNIDRRAARIEHSFVAGIPRTRTCNGARRQCSGRCIIMTQPMAMKAVTEGELCKRCASAWIRPNGGSEWERRRAAEIAPCKSLVGDHILSPTGDRGARGKRPIRNARRHPRKRRRADSRARRGRIGGERARGIRRMRQGAHLSVLRRARRRAGIARRGAHDVAARGRRGRGWAERGDSLTRRCVADGGAGGVGRARGRCVHAQGSSGGDFGRECTGPGHCRS